MKQSKILTGIFIVLLVAVGWLFCINGIMDGSKNAERKNENYKQCVAEAEDYVERKLYQKAIEQYQTVISVKNTEENWAALLSSYQAWYEESGEDIKEYLSAAKKASSLYPQNVDFCLKTAELALLQEDFDTAYQCLKSTVNAGVEDEKVLEQYQNVRYSVSKDWKSYLGYQELTNDYYAVDDTGLWGLISAANKSKVKCQYMLISSVGEDDVYVRVDDNGAVLIDMDGVIQGKISQVPEDASVYSEGLIALKYGEDWSYYNLLGDFQFGEYKNASCFEDGKAAVETEAGWMLIDRNGNPVSGITYEEIGIGLNGSWLQKDIMIAKKDGKYCLFDSKENQISNFNCDDIDVVTDDELIAYQDGEQWGFVDAEGKIVIEPVYAKAKSFSQGLAAISTDGKQWGFINESGKIVIEAELFDAGYFNNKGNCFVQVVPNEWSIITRNITE